MAINNSPVINDDSTDYPEESFENKEEELNDYLDKLEKETSVDDPEYPEYVNEKPSEVVSPQVDPELPGNILFSFVLGGTNMVGKWEPFFTCLKNSRKNNVKVA